MKWSIPRVIEVSRRLGWWERLGTLDPGNGAVLAIQSADSLPLVMGSYGELALLIWRGPLEVVDTKVGGCPDDWDGGKD